MATLLLALIALPACAAAPPAAASPTAPPPSAPPTAIPSPTVPQSVAAPVDEFAGRWYLAAQRLYLEYRADRTYEVRRANGVQADAGTFSFDGSRLTYLTSFACTDPAAVYEVRVRKEGGRTVELELSQVGNDTCRDRRIARGPWTRADP